LVAEGFGGIGFKIDRSNELEIEKVKLLIFIQKLFKKLFKFKLKILHNARNEHSKGNTVLINVLIGKTNFRDGSISV
jgi:hypothetical protein